MGCALASDIINQHFLHSLYEAIRLYRLIFTTFLYYSRLHITNTLTFCVGDQREIQSYKCDVAQSVDIWNGKVTLVCYN